MNKNNKGVTLVELMVVIAIMVVLAGTSLVGFRMISTRPAKECADRLKIALTSDRTTAMGKFNTEVYLYAEENGTIFLEENIYNTATDITKKTSRVGDSDVTVTYSIDGTDPANPLPMVAGGGGGLKLSFNRSTGGLKDYSGDVKIKCSKSGKSYLVTIYSITGKIVIEE